MLSSEKKVKAIATAASAARSFDSTTSTYASKKATTTVPIKSTLPIDGAAAASRLRAA